METCGRKLRRASQRVSPVERDHVKIGAVVKHMLLILYIFSIAQVTSLVLVLSRGSIVGPGLCFNS